MFPAVNRAMNLHIYFGNFPCSPSRSTPGSLVQLSLQFVTAGFEAKWKNIWKRTENSPSYCPYFPNEHSMMTKELRTLLKSCEEQQMTTASRPSRHPKAMKPPGHGIHGIAPGPSAKTTMGGSAWGIPSRHHGCFNTKMVWLEDLGYPHDLGQSIYIYIYNIHIYYIILYYIYYIYYIYIILYYIYIICII